MTLLLPLLLVAACTGRDIEAHENGSVAAGESGAVFETGDPDFMAARTSWISLADEPATHMRSALDAYEAGRLGEAARELDKSASLFRWGRQYTAGERERRDFTASAQELEEVARVIREGAARGAEPLHRALAFGHRTLAEHHLSAALREWEAGEHVRVALLLDAAATEVEGGFALSGEAPGPSIDAATRAARATADRLDSSLPPTEEQLRGVIRDLQDAVHGLGEVLGSRRH